ncbi:MAG: 3-hydroxyacyl-CoA dehydrogenase, partial [Acidobacteriota bacterium]|nr:3-hydroxyacyl-CoA dehydrogenase [Acidobacteriota bacterium]
ATAARDAVEAEGGTWVSHPAEGVIERMLEEFDRPGRLEGRGLYEYADGKRTGLWPGLREAFPAVDDPSQLSLRDIEERMLFIEAIESVRCFDEGVIESVADANIGSIMGIGYPPWTGGALQYINGYAPATHPQDRGLPGFVARARELAAQYGERFEPPASLLERAQRGEPYSDELVTAGA